jgi:integrase
MARRRLTDPSKLPRKEKRQTLPDPELVGHYLRIAPKGSRAPVAYVVIARGPDGTQRWVTIGHANTMSLPEARVAASRALIRIHGGKPISGALTVGDVASQWIDREVRKKQFRTAREIERVVNRYIIPVVGNRALTDIKRSDLASMLDQIEDDNGPAMADAVLKTFNAISRWHAERDDDFNPPAVTRMRRNRVGSRSRILSDDEIRALWQCEGQYADFLKLLLLTAQRRTKLLLMRWDDLSADIWTIATERREKSNAGMLQLPPIALEIIQRQPRFIGRVFPRSYASSTYKSEIDKLSGVTGWVLHDLRRTARSLMSRAGVPSDTAERVLGHSIGGVRSIYDRHSYEAEKGDALRKLAALIEQITSP